MTSRSRPEPSATTVERKQGDRRRLLRTPWAALFLAVALVLVAAAGTAGCGGSSGASASGDAQGSMGVNGPIPEPQQKAVQATDSGTAGKSTSGGSEDLAAAVPPATSPSAHHLLRTGDLSLLVARGTVLSTVARVQSMTAGMGGYVMSSAVGSDQSGTIEPQPLDAPVSGAAAMESQSTALTNPYATLTVRVPESGFDAAVKRFSKLGDVQSISTSSEDMTSQYVDLQARLRHYRAVEQRLVGFLGETTNVNQMLAVQDRIDRVQLQIEELSAQLKSLRETTTYGTLSIFVREKGVPQPGSLDSSDTFGGTFWNSIKLLGHGFRITGLILMAALPFLVVFGAVGLVAWYMIRRWRRGQQQPTEPTQPTLPA